MSPRTRYFVIKDGDTSDQLMVLTAGNPRWLAVSMIGQPFIGQSSPWGFVSIGPALAEARLHPGSRVLSGRTLGIP